LPVLPNELNGLLVVDKPGRPLTSKPGAAHDGVVALAADADERAGPAGDYLPTSHDVVDRVRRWSGQRRIGHTGTLDPLASGVLVLCLGTATRLVEYYQGETKQYYAEVRLGRATDTYDAVGAVTSTAPIPDLNELRIDQALEKFRGENWQLPPAYSAIKQGGEALYAKARRGETVTVTARRVTFHQLTLLEYQPPDWLALRVVCSAGAYVRSLAHDLGRALDTFGYLDGLRREAVGPFTLADAHSLPAIAQAGSEGTLAGRLLAPGTGLPLPAMPATAEQLQRLGFGQIVPMACADCDPAHVLVQVHDDKGQLAGIIRRLRPTEDDSTVWLCKAEKWLI